MAAPDKHHVHSKHYKPVHIAKVSPYKLWEQTVDAAPKNPTWNMWDNTLRAAIADYDTFLTDKPGYTELDFNMLKALMLEESGGPAGVGPNGSGAWFVRPFQIGNAGDAGLPALQNTKTKEHPDQIVPPETLKAIQAGGASLFPAMNIQAGIGYLLLKLAIFKPATVMDDDSNQYEAKITKEEPTFAAIAKKYGTTVDVLRKENPGVHETRLQIGQTAKFHKAVHYDALLSDFRKMTPSNMARYYNVSGDPKYAQKLEHCFKVVQENP